MKTLTYGEIPETLKIDEPYNMALNADDEALVCAAINQGIDSHLEAVCFDDHGIDKDGTRRQLEITNSESMRCLIRRLSEMDNDAAQDLASCMMFTLGFEWI